MILLTGKLQTCTAEYRRFTSLACFEALSVCLLVGLIANAPPLNCPYTLLLAKAAGSEEGIVETQVTLNF